MLIDKYGRRINYARLALTDVCNLRCTYCMPEQVRFCANKELLSLDEWLVLIQVLLEEGVDKIRFTGGEPLASPIFLPLLSTVRKWLAPEKIHITTNASYLGKYLSQLNQWGIKFLNISLDTLQSSRFQQITRRNLFPQVMQSINEALALGFQVKINIVIMQDVNADELEDFIELSKNSPLELRFIEEQPFQGRVWESYSCPLPYSEIYHRIQQIYPHIKSQTYSPSSTALRYQIPGYKGYFAIIPAFSRLLCHSCNRLRITPTGALKTCLYSQTSIDLKSTLRNSQLSLSEKSIILRKLLRQGIQAKPKDGYAADTNTARLWQSMNSIGG